MEWQWNSWCSAIRCRCLFCLNPCYNGMTMEFVRTGQIWKDNGVLILVIMEWQRMVVIQHVPWEYEGLNPCYNGMTMEWVENHCPAEQWVLILVIMEWQWNELTLTTNSVVSCLNPCYNGMTMESKSLDGKGRLQVGLNPCYNGMTMELLSLRL